MENATKALLIAAGMLFAIMILSLLVMGYGKISFTGQNPISELGKKIGLE